MNSIDPNPAPKSTTAPPQVRRMRFRITDTEPLSRHFVLGDIVMSHLLALLSGGFPAGEESFIRSVRRFTGEYDDPELKKRVAGFIGQEAVHGQQHRMLNDRLVEMGYPMVRLMNFSKDSRRARAWMIGEKMISRRLHLALTAAAEHYTATMAERILSKDEIQSIPGDPEVWNLLNWHVFEELEHKSVVFDVYRAVGGSERTRIFAMALLYYSMIPVLTVAVLASIATDPAGWRPITVARQAVGFFRGPIMRGLMGDLRIYMKRGFHPDDVDTTALLEKWQRELFGAESGALLDRMK
ncbi:metal-dependent hydrolase [Mycobacteroides chelonae]